MKKVFVLSVQPDPEGPVFGRVMDPDDFQKSQDYSHGHVDRIVKDLLVAGAPGPQVAGFNATVAGGMNVSVAIGAVVDALGSSYESDDVASVVAIAAAHPTLPRIDLIYGSLEVDVPAASEFRPFRQLRTQAELEAGTPPYIPTQFNQPTEIHTRVTIAVKTGVAGAVPVAPVAGAGEVPLWHVHVAAGQVTLVNGDLTSLRVLMKSLYQLFLDLATANIAIAALNAQMAGVELVSRKGQVNGYAGLDGAGKVPLAQLPSIAISDVSTVASQAAMLALVAERGDVAVRSDTLETYILSAEPATVLANWKKLLFPAPVVSFNTRTGAVVLTLADVTTALGFTPVNKAGDQMSGQLEIIDPTDVQTRRLHVKGGGVNASPATYHVAEVEGDLNLSPGITVLSVFNNYPGGVSASDGYLARIGSLLLSALTIRADAQATFGGNVSIVGSLSKGSGTFHIDHPLDPDNKDLKHGFIEAPRFDCLYRGSAVLVDGEVVVNIDTASGTSAGTFAAITQNPQVWLQNKDGWAKVRVKAGTFVGASFTIEADNPAATDTVEWMVVAERDDAFINAIADTDANGHLIVEPDKPEGDPNLLEPVVRTEEGSEADTKFFDELVPEIIGTQGYPRHASIVGTGAIPLRAVTLHIVVPD